MMHGMNVLLLFISISCGERLPISDHQGLREVSSSYLLLGSGKVDEVQAGPSHTADFWSWNAPDDHGPSVLLQPEDLACNNGVLELPKGRYQIDPSRWNGKKQLFLDLTCEKLTARSTTLELFVPLVFNSTQLEFDGQLQIVAKRNMTCLTILGTFVVTGDLMVEGCHMKSMSFEDALAPVRQYIPDGTDDQNNEVSDNEWEDSSILEVPPARLNEDLQYFSGGAIHSMQLIHHSGSFMIRNCSRNKGSGGAIDVDGNFTLLGGDLTIQNCSVGPDNSGGGISAEHISQLGGNLMIRHCSADRGGAISARDLFRLKSGRLLVEGCHGLQGGAFFARTFTMEGGHLQIHGCQAELGGAVFFEHRFWQLGGFLSIHDCTTTIRGVMYRYHSMRNGDGGAIGSFWKDLYFAKAFTQLNGTAVIANCTADGRGGAISASNVTLQGSLTIKNCSARRAGGAVSAIDLKLSAGHVEITECHSMAGGAISSKMIHVTGGKLDVSQCHAEMRGVPFLGEDVSLAFFAGGAVQAEEVLQSAGDVWIQNCSSVVSGGAINASEFQQSGGQMNIQQCSAQERGGGMSLGSLTLAASSLSLSECRARLGGAIFVAGKVSQSGDAKGRFENCSAEDGGALHLTSAGGASFEGEMEFVDCWADGRGGAVHVAGELQASKAFFTACSAKFEGGAIFGNLGMTLGSVTLNRCESGISGALTAHGNVKVSLLNSTDAEELKGQAVVCGGAASVDSLLCRGSGKRLCEVGAVKASAVGRLRCPVGAERSQSAGQVGCYSCSHGYVRLLEQVNPRCQQCPKQSTECMPAKLSMPAGMTIDPSNFSVGIYCPNPAACSGGALLASPSGENISREEIYHAMCKQGYIGDSCSRCADSYGQADFNPLTCIKCPALSTFSAVKSSMFYVIKDALLFSSAAASALTASGDKKHSSVFLNQLMAFATVANIVVTGVMQTNLFAEFRDTTQRMLEVAGLMANVAQAQGDGGASKDCLLKRFGIPGSLMNVHLISTTVPLALMALLALLKGPKLSLVVGANVFLPAFTAAFGKYLIAFCCKPEEEGGALQMPFMPSFPGEFLIPFAIVMCFLIGMAGWWSTIHGEAKPLPPYILYLTGSYKPECQAWEIERLVRKMLLSVLTCAIPVSYSPALQMEAVSVVLIVSISLQFYFMPYRVNMWNYIEFGLLVTALVLTGLTTTLIANDLHFARSRSVASLLILLVVLLVGVICGTMIVLVLVNIYREYKSKHQGEDFSEPLTG